MRKKILFTAAAFLTLTFSAFTLQTAAFALEWRVNTGGRFAAGPMLSGWHYRAPASRGYGHYDAPMMYGRGRYGRPPGGSYRGPVIGGGQYLRVPQNEYNYYRR